MDELEQDNKEPVDTDSTSGWRQLYQSEDWWAVWIGALLLVICLGSVLAGGRNNDGSFTSPLKKLVGQARLVVV